LENPLVINAAVKAALNSIDGGDSNKKWLIICAYI
jgi:hypothetical protein